MQGLSLSRDERNIRNYGNWGKLVVVGRRCIFRMRENSMPGSRTPFWSAKAEAEGPEDPPSGLLARGRRLLLHPRGVEEP